MTVDLDALEKLADKNLGYSWYELRGDIVTCGGSIGPDFIATPSTYSKEYILAVQPATIKALIALVKDAWAERDQLEQNIIDASNGRFPPQGQADPDDEIDGLAHMVYGLRRERAFLARNGKGEG